MFLPILLSCILFTLGIIHFNWVFGGKFGFAESLPTNEKGERVLNPKKVDSAIVGLGLMGFGFFYLTKSGLIGNYLPEWIINYVGWAIPLIFILRSVGEFKYVGFFKSIRDTDFGKMDSKFFSPLCLILGILGILVQIF